MAMESLSYPRGTGYAGMQWLATTPGSANCVLADGVREEAELGAEAF
jgi:hypothetical protein